MKKLTTRTLLTAWTITILFTLAFMLAFLVSYWFIVPALFLLVCYVILVVKVLLCPYCGAREHLINLTFAIYHPYYCQLCGCQIIIQRRTNNEKV